MERAVIIETSSGRVDNITMVTRNLPTLPDGFRHIREADWAEGQQPNIGDTWDNTLPASFIPPAPSDTSLDEMDVHELVAKQADLIERQRALADEAEALATALQRNLGG